MFPRADLKSNENACFHRGGSFRFASPWNHCNLAL
jgi:hypothetical protein